MVGVGGCRASLGRGTMGGRWLAGEQARTARAAVPVSQGELARAAEKRQGQLFFFTPPRSSFFYLFAFFKEKHIQLFNAAPAKSRHSEDGGRCRSRRRLKGDMHFFFFLLFFFFVAARAPGNAISHHGEASPARRLHPSTYMELGNYGLAENSGERRRRQLPPPEEKSRKQKKKNSDGPHACRYR